MKNQKTNLTIILFFLFSIVLITSSFQCNDCDSFIDNRSSFKIKIEQLEKSYNIGDTIWISADFDSNLELENSSFRYDNSNQIGDIDFQIWRIEANNKKINKGINDFDYIVIKGKFYNIEYNTKKTYEIEKRVEFNCTDTTCSFKFGVICSHKGIYGFKVWGGNFGYKDNSDCQSNKFDGVTFDIKQNNFTLCKEINTNSLFVETRFGGRTFYDKPLNAKYLYFFKVE